MNELTLIALVVVVLLAFWPLWPQQTNERLDQKVDDERLTPLLRGINYLLNDDAELALQELLQVARMHTETAEVYLALGEMFRNKGEVGRAIHVHQSLLARPDLPPRLMLETALALAKDYQSGGFLDRAMQQYQKVLMQQWDHLFALRASLRIYEQTANWQAALSCLDLLSQVEQEDMSLHRAYLLVEAALHEQALRKRKQQLELAIEVNAKCQHAWLCLIAIALDAEDFTLARQYVWDLDQQDPNGLVLIPIYFPDALDALHAVLLRCWKHSDMKRLALNWMEVIREKQGEAEMLALRDELLFVPDGLATHLRYIALVSDDQQLQQQIQRWKKVVVNYCCHVCGVRVLAMHWQCPQCHCWGKMYSLQDEV